MTELLGRNVLKRLGKPPAGPTVQTQQPPPLAPLSPVTQAPTAVIATSAAPDHRAEEMRLAGMVEEAVREAVRGRMEGIVSDPAAIDQITTVVVEVRRINKGMRDDAVRIGRLLAKLRRSSPAAYGELFRGEDSPMPITESVASKMISVAEAVDTGQVTLERLPHAYSAAYEIVTLARTDPEGFREAEKKGLIAPETRRKTVLEFKIKRKRVLNPPSRSETSTAELALLRDERVRLTNRLAEIDRRLAELGES